jgi:tRNA (guanine37-N1)-methyltransferase
VILTSPQGKPFTQADARRLSGVAHLVLLCGRYEGFDDRVRERVTEEVSIGDYILTGGELPALVVIDTVLRLLPGAIDAASTAEESFADGLLEYPQYTRPAAFEGQDVPAVLVSGDHGAVRKWRLRESLRRTLLRRPDLLAERRPTKEEERLLDEIRGPADDAPG